MDYPVRVEVCGRYKLQRYLVLADEMDNLDAVICKAGGDRRVDAVSDGEGVHVVRAVKHGGGGVGEAGDGGGAGGVGELYNLDAVVCTGGDRRVGAA